MTTGEVERPAGLGRYCLREMQMEAVNDRLLEGAMELLQRSGWLRLTSSEIASPPIAPK